MFEVCIHNMNLGGKIPCMEPRWHTDMGFGTIGLFGLSLAYIYAVMQWPRSGKNKRSAEVLSFHLVCELNRSDKSVSWIWVTDTLLSWYHKTTKLYVIMCTVFLII